jgi:dTDP-4-amino-4,6-dideoxygalactose transaminase
MLHYSALDDSPFGSRFRAAGEHPLAGARSVTERMVRLPLFTRMTDAQVEEVISATYSVCGAPAGEAPGRERVSV